MNKFIFDPIVIDTTEILQFKIDKEFHIWPLIRFDLLSGIENSNQLKLFSATSQKTKFFNLLKGLSGIKIKKVPIQFITTTLLNVKQNDSYKNILDDYFYDVFPEHSFIYENLDPVSFDARNPRKHQDVSTLFTYIDLIPKFLAKFVRIQSNTSIELFCTYLEEKNISSDLIAEIKSKLYTYQKRLKVQQLFYRVFLRITKPKILFVNCACYGASNAILINEAKKLGILTAEIQHGVIDHKHFAYNYADEMVQSEVYRQYMPDYLLTFGEYWHSKMNNSCEKIVVGHPHLSYKRHQWSDHSVADSYLFISQWTITDVLIDFAIELRSSYPSSIIAFRLHHLEQLTGEQEDKLMQHRIDITSSASDIYDEFSRFENIVGCYSTALYEAKAFSKKVYIVEHELSEKYGFYDLGIVAKNIKSILENNANIQIKKYDSLNFYIDGFTEKYKEFINQRIKRFN
jgi:hypothetical protein